MKSRRRFAAASLLLLLVFAGNVCVGKYRLWSGTGTAAPLDGVPEFFLLLAAVACAVAAAIRAERAKSDTLKKTGGPR